VRWSQLLGVVRGTSQGELQRIESPRCAALTRVTLWILIVCTEMYVDCRM